MNRKGFTLIELLAVIIVIALIAVLVAPSVINSYNKSKEKAYNILIENIKIAGENYYQECEYGDLSDDSKYGELACIINNNTKTTTVPLGNLAKLGILKTSNENNGKISNPKTGEDISSCTITITKNVDINLKATFTIDASNACISGE